MSEYARFCVIANSGLDLVSSPLVVDPGRAWSMVNYVPSEGGYRRLPGYERKDGRPSPSDATYWMLGYTLGPGAMPASVGNTITAGAVTATVLAVIPDDDEYVLGELSGDVVPGIALSVSGTPAGTAVGTPPPADAEPGNAARKNGAGTVQLDLEYRDLAASHRRAAIEKVPGTGPVRGVHFYKNDLYAFRDVAPDSGEPIDARMFRATAGGWSEVNLGHALRFDGGSEEPLEGDRISVASGAAATYPTSERFSRGNVALAATMAGRNALHARCVAGNAQTYSAENPITTNIGNLPNADNYIIRQRYLLRLSKKWNRMTFTSASVIDDAALFYILGSDRFGTLDGSRYIAGVGQAAYSGSLANLNATVDPNAAGWGEADADGFYWVVLEFYFVELAGGQACNVRLGWRNEDNTAQAQAVVNAVGGIATAQAAPADGAMAILSGYRVTDGAWSSDDAAGVLYLNVESGAFADNDTLRRGAEGSETDFAMAAGEATPTTLPAGGAYRFINHNFKGQAESRAMFGVQGRGNAFRYDGIALALIPTGHADDRPTHVAVHSQHLLLAYPGGSLIVSETGNPLGYTAAKGAAEIATGQEINGLAEGVGLGNTLIMGEDRMQVLYGDDSANFVARDMSDAQTGGVEGTLQQVGGPLYMDNRGVRSVTTTDAYGNFVIGTMTADIQPWIDRQRDEKNPAIGSMRVRSRDQYRLWFRSGIGICVYLGRGRPEMSFFDYGSDDEVTLAFDEGEREPRAGQVLTGASSGATARVDSVVSLESGTWAGGDAAGTLRLYDVLGTFRNDEVLRTADGQIGRANGSARPAPNQVYPVCVVSAEDGDRIERVYFGAPNGFVYEAERGRSFDGREIVAYCRLPLNHVGSPIDNKRFFAADLHMDLESLVKMSLSAIYGDGLQPEQVLREAVITGGGGVWDEAIWDDFYWDAPLNGYHQFDLYGFGRNVSILLMTRTRLAAPHTLNGLTLHYARRRKER